MGGIGSGRRQNFDKKDTTEDLHSIDIRHWARERLLKPGQFFNWQWYRQGEVVASIKVEATSEAVVLDYMHRSGGEDWNRKRYPIQLSQSPCHFGGARKWFLCPEHRCGRRVAIIYGGAIFACRQCHNLAYPSQREDASDRAARRAERIRIKLGWEPGILNGDWGRPKGMHRRTFLHLSEEHYQHVEKYLKGIRQRFGFDPL